MEGNALWKMLPGAQGGSADSFKSILIVIIDIDDDYSSGPCARSLSM